MTSATSLVPVADPRPDGGRRYARNATLAASARIAPLAVQLLATPLVIAFAGPESYAVWALMATAVSLLLTADLGVVGIMQRYHGVARGRRDPALGGRVTGTVVLVLVLLLVVVVAAGPAIADAILSVVRVDPGVLEGARIVFANVATIAVLQLLGLAMIAYLAAHERFGQLALASFAARAVGAATLVTALLLGTGLTGLVIAAYVDALVGLALGLALCWRHLAIDVRGLVRGAELRELWGYSWRNQASAIGFVAQRESDVVLAAILLSVAAQATVASTAQLAAAAALAPTVLLVPLFTQLSTLAGVDPRAATSMLHRAESTWLTWVVPFAAVVVVTLPLFAAGWLGPEIDLVYETTALFAVGYLIALLNSVRSVLVRSIGRPGLETASYLAAIVLKLGLGIPAALMLGVVGLAATTIVGSLGAVVVLWVLTARIDGLRGGVPSRWSVTAGAVLLVLGGAVSIAVHLLVTDRLVTVAAAIALGVAMILVVVLVARANRSGDDFG